MVLHKLEVIAPVVALQEVGGAGLVLHDSVIAAPHLRRESRQDMLLYHWVFRSLIKQYVKAIETYCWLLYAPDT